MTVQQVVDLFRWFQNVQIRVVFLRIIDIDTVGQQFEAEVYIEARWTEKKFQGRSMMVYLHDKFMLSLIQSLILDLEKNDLKNLWNMKPTVSTRIPFSSFHIPSKKKKSLINKKILRISNMQQKHVNDMIRYLYLVVWYSEREPLL